LRRGCPTDQSHGHPTEKLINYLRLIGNQSSKKQRSGIKDRSLGAFRRSKAPASLLMFMDVKDRPATLVLVGLIPVALLSRTLRAYGTGC